MKGARARATARKGVRTDSWRDALHTRSPRWHSPAEAAAGQAGQRGGTVGGAAGEQERSDHLRHMLGECTCRQRAHRLWGIRNDPGPLAADPYVAFEPAGETANRLERAKRATPKL